MGSSAKGEGRINPSLATPLSGPATAHPSGASSGWRPGALEQAPRRRPRRGVRDLRSPRAIHPGLHPDTSRREAGENLKSCDIQIFLKLELIGKTVGLFPS